MARTVDIVGTGWTFPPQIGPQGGVALSSEFNEIEQAMKIILLTSPGQRVMRPTFGCRIHELVFAPNNHTTATQAMRFVEDALAMWEPRIIVNNVHVYPDPDRANRLMIDVQYQLKATSDPRSLVFPFYLIPEE
ncbi:MAG: GPW/gp25 family protein [Anaerolineales bacterium]|nr:GPW/gp25 family protein [Anaerolineales bacterium]